MSKNMTRRNFVTTTAAVAGVAALAGCASTSDEGSAATEATSYPIDPDGDDVEALWTSEETRDGWIQVTNPDDGATLGVMDSAKIIQVDGLAFRDMNGNGVLDEWEDWRLDADTRAAALAETLSAEECFPLFFAGGTYDAVSVIINGGTVDDEYEWIPEGSRSGVSRLNSDAESYASDVAWINEVQQKCEEDNGIPYLNYSDPYVLFNVPQSVGLAACMDKDVWRKAGMWQARAWRATGVRCDLGPQVDVYSNPIGGRLSGSVSEDPALNRDFAAAFGGGMQSTWGDDEATEDLGWGDESCAVMLKHYAGAGAVEGGRNDHNDTGKWNVFPGSNINAHLVPFIDGGMNLDSETEQVAAIMPCYGIAYDPNDDSYGEHVGAGYSKYLTSIMRNAGWDGMFVSDWEILTNRAFGVDDLTEGERMAKMLDCTVNQHGGSFNPELYDEAYETLVAEYDEDTVLAKFQDSARQFFKVMFNLQLFDQPYSDRTVAKAIFESDEPYEFGIDASDKCVIMLKNAGGVISEGCMADKPKVYIPQMYSNGSIAQSFGADFADDYFEVVTDTVGEATGEASEDGTVAYQESDIVRLTADELADVEYAIIKVNNPTDPYGGVQTDEDGNNVYYPISLQYRPYTADGDNVRTESLNPEDEYGEYENRSYYGNSTYSSNESSLDLVIDTKANLPEGAKLILVVDATNPMCYYEIEPYADVILMGFGSLYEEAYAHIISGEVEPYGLLPFQMPLDMDTVEAAQEDVSRDLECYTDSEGNTYDFAFGLNWSGVIDDDRTATYKADPLTDCETATVTPDED